MPPERHLSQELRVRLEDVVGMRLDVLLQEERAHVRRGMKRLILEEIPSDFKAGLLHLFVLPVVEEVVQEVQRVTGGAGFEQGVGGSPGGKV